jgi:hypothetical protein
LFSKKKKKNVYPKKITLEYNKYLGISKLSK